MHTGIDDALEVVVGRHVLQHVLVRVEHRVALGAHLGALGDAVVGADVLKQVVLVLVALAAGRVGVAGGVAA